ncbi:MULTISPECIES: motility protein A [Oerskovia]|uniref:MotA/TolQ/ExbB proton channel family protein n=2 Tax=Oerskovia TaxID=162491 RepID=A0ABR8V574_9CELL|nr:MULTISPECIES: MotA/TolQ/ExbB proton channel family protein [Oerskovia]MBD7999943.1 MotA/TolQ/ExbB proton channel family protein [Oerskovia gallyi]MBM7496288.1 chemotaxis protein MotA [Oerskovia paurometabola]
MDPATIIGILFAFGALVAMVLLEGAQITSILLPAPIILVFGASILVAVASGTVRDALQAVKALPRAFMSKPARPADAIEEVVRAAEIVQNDGGLLALEAESQKTDDPFQRSALQSLADGADADQLRTLLEERIETKSREDAVAYDFYNAIGGYAPTIGIVGTVVSLTHVLENLSDPAELGHMIAAAFIATLWGILSANFIWLPIGAKLKRISDLEIQRLDVLLEGYMSIQAGARARVIDERLKTMVPEWSLPPGKAA